MFKARAYLKDGTVELDVNMDRARQILQDAENEVWIDIERINGDEVAFLQNDLKIHPIAIEEVLAPLERPEMQSFENHVLLVLHAPSPNLSKGGMDTIEIDFLVGNNFIATVRSGPIASVKDMEDRIKANPRIMSRGCDFMLYFMADAMVDDYTPVLNAIEKLNGTPVEVIAPSHGLIWRSHPEQIIELYTKWAGYATGETEVGVTLLYGSMYGNTEEIMNSVAKGIANNGVPVEVFDVARTHTSYILPSLWTKKGVIVGAPTYEGSLYPAMRSALEEAAIKRVMNKTSAIFGSYGWSGGAEKKIRSIIEPLKWNVTSTFIFRGGPTEQDLKKALEFGRDFAAALK